MEAEAVSAAFCWLRKSHFPHVLFVTDLLSMFRKIETEKLQTEWLESLKKTDGWCINKMILGLSH